MQALDFVWCLNLPGETRRRRDIREIIVHRIEVSQEDPSFGDTPSDVARFFADHAIGRAATGGAMPYPLLVGVDGRITQTAPLRGVAPHARAHNVQAIGVGVIGDFRRQAPPPPQYEALVRLCAALLHVFVLPSAAILAHDTLIEGSHDPDKVCPGPHLPIDRLRHDVAAATAWLDLVW